MNVMKANHWVIAAALLYVDSALADCAPTDTRLLLGASVFVEPTEYADEADALGVVGLAAECHQELGPRAGVRIDLELLALSDRDGIEPNVHELYAYRDFSWKNARAFAGFKYDRTGFLEAFTLSHAASQRGYSYGPIERSWNGALMVGMELNLDVNWTVQGALVDNHSLGDDWRPGGMRLSPVGIDLGQERFEGARAAYALQARYYGSDVELIFSAWNGASRTAEVRFDPQSMKLDRFYRRQTSLGMSGEYALNDQSLRFDLRVAEDEKGISRSAALGYIRYVSGLLGSTSISSFYVEYYRETTATNQVGSAFDNDIAVGADIRIGDAALSTVELTGVYDVERGSRLLNASFSRNLTARVRATVGYERYRIAAEDEQLRGFDNDDRWYVNAEFAF